MIITSDKHGRTDSVYHSLLPRLSNKYPIVIVSWVDGFVFNDALLNIKNYVLVDFCEYGWNYEIQDSHIWGKNLNKNGYGDGRYKGKEWEKLENWVKQNPFKIFFKRELLKKDVADTIRPIEYPCLTNLYPIESRQQFDNRPINAMQYWGRSNEERLRIHGEIWLHAYKKGFQPCDNIYYYNQYMHEERSTEKWLTFWIPHWARIDINELLKINGCSKLSLSWAGAGFKCFRTAESPINSTMVMHQNNHAWTFSWDSSNCILAKKGFEIFDIEAALCDENLYDVYVAGVENAKKYYIDYYSNHLNQIINNA